LACSSSVIVRIRHGRGGAAPGSPPTSPAQYPWQAIDGRGWFRTSDLSRVKRQAQKVRTASTRRMRRYLPRCLRLADYRGLRTITGDSGRKNGFLPKCFRTRNYGDSYGRALLPIAWREHASPFLHKGLHRLRPCLPALPAAKRSRASFPSVPSAERPSASSGQSLSRRSARS
jgi:hypothetical protein